MMSLLSVLTILIINAIFLVLFVGWIYAQVGVFSRRKLIFFVLWGMCILGGGIFVSLFLVDYYYVLLYFIPPLTATVIAEWRIYSRWKMSLQELGLKEADWEKTYHPPAIRFIAFYQMLLVPIIYAYLCLMLLYMSNTHGLNIYEGNIMKVALAGGILLGTSGFFSTLGEAAVGYEAMQYLPKETPPPSSLSRKEKTTWMNKNSRFGIYLVLFAMPQTAPIFALLLTLLLYFKTGILSGESLVFSDAQANSALLSSFIFGVGSIGAFLSGYLPTKQKGDLLQVDIFAKKIKLAGRCLIITIVGFLIAILIYINAGIIG